MYFPTSTKHTSHWVHYCCRGRPAADFSLTAFPEPSEESETFV